MHDGEALRLMLLVLVFADPFLLFLKDTSGCVSLSRFFEYGMVVTEA